MSKAIAGAAMLAGAAGLLATAAFLPGLGWALGPVLMHAILGTLAAGGLSMEAAAIGEALTSNRGQNITTRMAAGLRQIVYGMQRIGATTIYQSTTGAGGSGGNYIYNYIDVVASHVIDGYVNLYLDGRQVYWSQTANGDGFHANIGCGALAVPPTTTVSISGGAITAITASGGSGLANIKPMDGYRVVIRDSGGGTGARAWAYNSGSPSAPSWSVTIEKPGTGYTSATTAEIQGAYTFGGYFAADQQDPSLPGYGLGYGIGPDGQHYNFSNKGYCEVRFGDQLPGDYMASLGANDSNWAGGGLGSGQARAHAVMGSGPYAGTIEMYVMDDNGEGYAANFSGTVTGSGASATYTAMVAGGRVTALVPTGQSGNFSSIPSVPLAAPTGTAAGAGSPWVGGCAYLYINIGYDTNNFPSAPEKRVTITGKNDIYDPRTSKSSYSVNWALQVADVLRDPVWGLGDGPIASWPTAAVNQLIAAANVCDELVLTSQGYEANYTQHIHYDSSTSPGDALALMMPTAAGRLRRIGGGWMIFPAYWQGPSFVMDESALIGPVQWTPTRSFKDIFNRVNGTYIAPNFPYSTKVTGGVPGQLYDQNGWYYGTIDDVWPFAFQPTNFPQYAQDTLHGYSADEWLAQDGGIVLPKELTLRGCLSIVQAQRVAKIVLLRNRFQGSGTFPMGLGAWAMQSLDVMEFTIPALGWSNKVLEIDDARFTIEEQKQSSDGGEEGPPAMALSLSVPVIETDPTIYEWSEGEELTPYDVPAAPSQIPNTPAPPTTMTVLSSPATGYLGADGIWHPRAVVSWNAPEDITVKQIQVQYQLATGSSWVDAGMVDVGLFETYVGPLVAGGTHNFQIRSVRSNGVYSVWVQEFGLVVDNTFTFLSSALVAVAPPGTLTNVIPTVFTFTASVNVHPFTARLGTSAVSCLGSGIYTINGLAKSTFYYIYYVDAGFSGGAITPIATTNVSDFYLQAGYYLIGAIRTIGSPSPL